MWRVCTDELNHTDISFLVFNWSNHSFPHNAVDSDGWIHVEQWCTILATHVDREISDIVYDVQEKITLTT